MDVVTLVGITNSSLCIYLSNVAKTYKYCAFVYHGTEHRHRRVTRHTHVGSKEWIPQHDLAT